LLIVDDPGNDPILGVLGQRENVLFGDFESHGGLLQDQGTLTFCLWLRNPQIDEAAMIALWSRRFLARRGYGGGGT
jgi:hypothetical protein